LDRINREFAASEPGYQDRALSSPALRRLREHDWPGNARELNNVLLQAAVMSAGTALGRSDIDAAITRTPGSMRKGPFVREREEGFDLRQRLKEIEGLFIEDALRDSDGNQTKAAELLGLSQQALNKKLGKVRVP
jgi:DNA-binding NtrC family response regulator